MRFVTATIPPDLHLIDPGAFEIHTLDDEIRVDLLCVELLQAVRDHLVIRKGLSPPAAGEICRGADYFLRDFIIAECADNLFRLSPGRIRQFAGHWYIVRTLEPNGDELASLLAGIAACYRIFADHRLVAPDVAAAIDTACGDHPYYRQRIEEFWAIEDDGFDRWRNACPLPKART
jgi:hypothetical protein